MLRQDTSCTGPVNATLPASSLPANPQLYTSPLFVGNDDGSMVFSADRFGVPEPTSLVMCISNANGTTFTATPITLQVNPSRIIADNDANHVTPQVAYLGGALTGALVVPLKTRGDVNIGDLVSPLTNAVVSVNNGTLVMFSLTCMYNSHGLPLSTVTQDSFVGLSYNHTSSPTPTLKICIRRLWTFQDNNATFQTSYETPLFIDTGLTFRVLNISIESISVHALVSGVEAQHDINFMLFHPRGRDVLIPLTFGFEPLIDRPPRFAQQDDSVESSILDSLDDVNTLAFFELAQFRVGRPCNVPAPSAVSADVRSTAVHTATFTNGTVLVIPDSPTGFEVPLRVDPQFAADPWSPYSLCFSVDGGAHYVSAGVAYFTATWAPTLFALSSSDEDATFSQQVTVWEATSAYMAFTDARYDARILTVTKDSSFVDTPLSEALNRFTIHSLWTGFLSGVGYAQAGVLYIPSSVVSDGENITSSNALAALAPSTPSPITFTYDVNAQNINTGVTLTVSPMQLNCLEGSLTRVYINGEETGRSFDISDSCPTSINDGAILRIAPSCANPSAFVGDIVVDASMHLVLPYILPFLANGAYQVCLRKYLPYRISAALGQESEFIQTLVTLEMSRTSMIDQIDGITSGVLVGFYGDEFAVPVTGAGMSSSTSVIVSLVDVGSSVSLANITNAHTDDACTAILTYVDSEGRPQSSNTLLDWFPMESGGVWRIPANVNVPPAKNASSVDGSTVTPSKTYLVCASFDFGLSFHKAGNGIYYTLVPPTAVSIVPYQLSKGFELYYPTTTTSNSIQYLRVLLPATSANATASTTTSSYPTRAERVVGVQAPKVFDFFIPSGVALNTIRFVGNGIGKKSNRTAPLYVALVDTSIVGPRCNGTITSAATAAILTVDSHTGAIIKSTSPSALLPTNTAAGAEYIVCTSIDQVNYFSPDVPSFLASDDGWSAVSHVPLSATTLDTTTSSWSTRLAQYVPQSTYLFAQKSDAATAYLSDMTMTIRFLIKATNASTVDPTRINVTSSAFVVLQARIAASLGCNYPPAAVALSVSGSLGTYSTNVSGNATSSYAQLVALNIQLLSEGRANVSANIISRESLYQLLWNRTVNSTNASYHLFQPLVDASFHVAVVPVTILLSLDNGVEVRSSPICTGGESIPTLTDDGKSTTTNSVYFSPNDVRSMGASASTIVAALCKISPQLVSTETVEDLTEDDFQAKSTWSVIPIIMIIPVLIFVGTYQLYTRYFDIVTPEELAARNKQVDDDMNLRREKRTLALRGGEQDRSILAGVKDASLELKREGKEMASNVQTALQDGVTTAAAGAQSVLTTVAAHATAVQETVVQQGKEFGTAISDKVSTAADGVTKAASNVQSALTTAATTAASNITNAASTAASNITTVASNISAAASNIASGSGPSSSSAAPVAPDAAAV
ncbi:Hypothetical protein, putative [Bodo saltans]|uniref:Uncharacterized protein n=1 Tax=Bodo saltans TaxID=75058 RepID=A0A0S4JCB3_BODSA|nr:Hypothetical protein, putative [Bodo saltans]|eukprot:CUG87813.1 Hypothetical protein, putative [Bodo saltans]